MMPNCKKCRSNAKLLKVDQEENKENAIDLDPSKAWIKNIGVGSAKKPSKRYLCPNHTLISNPAKPQRDSEWTKATLRPKSAMALTLTPKSIPSSAPLTPSTPLTVPNILTIESESTANSPYVSPEPTIMNITEKTLDTSSSNNSDESEHSNENDWKEGEPTIVQTNHAIDTAEHEVHNGGPQKSLCTLYAEMEIRDETFTMNQRIQSIAGVKAHDVSPVSCGSFEIEQLSVANITSIGHLDTFGASLAENTLIPFNSTELSTTCARIDSALNGSDGSCISYRKFFSASFSLCF